MNDIDIVYVKRKDINVKDYVGKVAQPGHYDMLVKNTSLIYPEGNRPILYISHEDSAFDAIIPHLVKLDFNPSNRKSTGKNNHSILFGAITAKINRSSFCNVGSLLSKDSDLHYHLIEEISPILNELFKSAFPQWHAVGNHFYNKANVHPDYQMPGGIHTSGIINYNSPHIYHHDDSNLKNTYSAMITFKRDTSGGYLVMPEYGLALETSNRSITFFYGRNILHGVLPISYHSDDAYRYSIVFYTLGEIAKCKSINEELYNH